MTIPNADFHEVWWIFSPVDEGWAGLRVAHFRKTVDGTLYFIIPGDMQHRVGLRDWAEVSEREHWTKVEQIAIPKVPARLVGDAVRP